MVFAEKVTRTEIDKIFCLNAYEQPEINLKGYIEKMIKIEQDDEKMTEYIWQVVPKYNGEKQEDIVADLNKKAGKDA